MNKSTQNKPLGYPKTDKNAKSNAKTMSFEKCLEMAQKSCVKPIGYVSGIKNKFIPRHMYM